MEFPTISCLVCRQAQVTEVLRLQARAAIADPRSTPFQRAQRGRAYQVEAHRYSNLIALRQNARSN